jgi:dolichyl-phosphate-mannose-protein mannosyltransferase
MWSRLQRAFADNGPLLAVVAALVLLGVGLRMFDLGFPAAMSFDEHHFVENARNYLDGKPDWNDHPPLGKLLIAIGMAVGGDSSFGWRVVPMLFGVLNVYLAYQLARRLFADEQGAWIAAALVAADGFLIAYSRTALLDGMLTSFVLLTAVVAATATTPRAILGAAVLAGCAASIKISGVALLLPLGVACFLNVPAGRPRLMAFAALLGLPVAYFFIYDFGLRIAGLEYGPAAVARATAGLVRHHLGLTQMTHPLTSRWYTWFLPARPITLRFDAVDASTVRGLTTMGNPLLWWASAAVVLFSAQWAIRREPAIAAPPRPRVVLLLAFWVAMLLPWIISRRDSYIYHYLPSYTFGLVLLAGWLGALYHRHRLPVLAALVVVAEVSVFYAPVWAQLPLTQSAWQLRLFLPGWR